MSSNGVRTRGELKWVCSCDIRQTGDGIADSPCWHMETVRTDSAITAKLMCIVECGFQEDHSLYFGDTLEVLETDGCVKYEFKGDASLSLYSRTENLDGIIAIQLDDVQKEDLVNKGTRVANRWSCWLTVDPVERLMISVAWKPVSRGMVATRMMCSMCRTDMNRKCSHEVACDKECQYSMEEGECSGDEYSDIESDIGNDGNSKCGEKLTVPTVEDPRSDVVEEAPLLRVLEGACTVSCAGGDYDEKNKLGLMGGRKAEICCP